MLVAQTSNFFPAIYTMEQYVIDYSHSQPLPYFHKMEGPGPIPMCENEGQDTEASERKEFILKHPENVHLNQYWYSARTIASLASEVEEQASATGGEIAFLSTPSLYFSISPTTRQRARLFDFDVQWAWDPGFVLYNYKHLEALPVELKHRFTMVVIDPPFITEEVWKMYAKAAKYLLLKSSGNEGEKTRKRNILCTTVSENAGLLQALLGVKERRFKPSIPTLVYQFSSFSNYESARLDAINPELM